MVFDTSQLTRPGADPALSRNTQRASDLMLAKMAGSKPAGAPPAAPQDVYNAAAGTTSAVGNQVLKQAAGEVSALKGQAGATSAGEAATGSAAVGEARLTRQKQATDNEAALASLDATTKRRLFDDRTTFQSNVVGQGALQTSQLVDWATTKAKSQQQLDDYKQSVEQATQKQELLYKQGYDAMSATLEADAKGQIQKLDEQTKLQITAAQSQFKLQYEQAKAKAQSNVQLFQGAGMVVGGVVGAIYGGPVGAAAGASLGGAAGGMVGSAAESTG